jgi:hypothetical protein
MHLRQIENGNGDGTITVTERYGQGTVTVTERYGQGTVTVPYDTVTLQNRNFHCMLFWHILLGRKF